MRNGTIVRHLGSLYKVPKGAIGKVVERVNHAGFRASPIDKLHNFIRVQWEPSIELKQRATLRGRIEPKQVKLTISVRRDSLEVLPEKPRKPSGGGGRKRLTDDAFLVALGLT